ncbi:MULTISPECIES: hypothetical protein [unclassified Rhodococcus (in: high G+C Gram-positive bacteria)]|uniref:hypothetical protein n=1 Tax=Rhodococcus sp. SJ-3 TaxID=3454628 RepID=UPI003F7B1B62
MALISVATAGRAAPLIAADDEKVRRVVETLPQCISELAQIAEQLKQQILM